MAIVVYAPALALSQSKFWKKIFCFLHLVMLKQWLIAMTFKVVKIKSKVIILPHLSMFSLMQEGASYGPRATSGPRGPIFVALR